VTETDRQDERPAPVLLEDRNGAVLTLTLNRPTRLNAVNPELYGWLAERLEKAAVSTEIRVVVLTGAGRAFCVGADLQAHGSAPLDDEARDRYVASAQAVNRRIQTLSKPVVAAVNGHAIGAGLELALSCDLVVCAREAKLRLPEAALGTFVGGGVTYTLARRVGELRARELLLLCPFVRGEDSESMGLANRVVDAVDVLPTALELAQELARRAPTSIRLLKALLHRAPTLSSEETLRLEAEALLTCMATKDWAEGVAAFKQRRDPEFTGE
jgi:enoyl-CoA hydratase/carnithine racemase